MAAMGRPEEELFEIQLESIDRELDVDLGGETLEIEFAFSRTGCRGHVRVSIEADSVTTTEIVPVAMSDLHRAFAALAEQTKGWAVEVISGG
ncbi:hypothetical protein [Methylobacterium sp. E-045]|uniref:hypothetical protein n=1 Tax=Methylobacterium sp. E-045 TaxID=2836575 RepID=UPI001FBBD9A3|nr:hypothetical protein [Methylobacterium sp. E-045]MCJ2127991.1 hypothetical protein [Methylobacterium sp. E-045]